jgi:FkbM family methyltransferase
MLYFSPRLSRTPLIGRFIQNVLRAYANHWKPRYFVENRTGLTLLIDQRNLVDRYLLVYGEWENEQFETLCGFIEAQRKQATKPTLFLDVGAHGGLYSMWLKQRIGFDRLVAFEPEPQNYAQLRANLFMNGMARSVETRELAVSDQAGTVSFYSQSQGNRGGSRIDLMDQPDVFAEPITVQTARLDDLFSESGQQIVLKIDVEGHEEAVLRGMTRLLAENDCILQIEIWPQRTSTTTAFLAEHGYRLARTIGSDFFFVAEQARPEPQHAVPAQR